MCKDLGIKSIIESEIDENVLKSHVFDRLKRIESSFFHSNQVSFAMKEYIDEGFVRDKAKVLWKELLIDAICLLKINDSREASFLLGAKKDENLFVKEFKKMRNVSSFGIDELEAYFGDFADFESVLYNEKYYRDHIHHVIHVWGVGVSLLFSGDGKRIDPKLPEGLQQSRKLFHNENNSEDKPKNEFSQTELWAIWTIIALCHDLGYPLEKASKINQKVKRIVNHFGCFDFDELNFKFDILNTFLIDKFLKVISSKPVSSVKNKAPVGGLLSLCGRGQENCGLYHTEVQQKYLDKFSKSLEEYKHGMFSGLLLFKKLVYFLETDFAPRSKTISEEDRRQFIIRREILRSICCHTCPKIYHIDLNTLSFLLILCDEIQEWNRPRFEDFINKKEACAPKTTISEFKVDKDKTSISVTMEYNSSEDISYQAVDALAIKKFQSFIYLLRSAKDDTNRNISFKWKTTIGKLKLEFTFGGKECGMCPFTVKVSTDSMEPCSIDIYGTDYKEKIKEYITRANGR